MSYFERLKDFICNKMQMQHIYQPVMLRTLLERGGRSSITAIAQEFLARDRAQLEYYEAITRAMPGPVLARHGLVEREGSEYVLPGAETLTNDEARELIGLCDQVLSEYVYSKGAGIWAHRRKSSGYVSGTLKYEVLKRAQFRCELCGAGPDERALEVDHIRPRNHGGKDDPDNLQALCYRCNAMKRDRDSTDFRGWQAQYEHRETGCPFCEMPLSRVILENELAYAIRDGYPVTRLHTLVIPRRHVRDYFGLTRPELNASHRLVEELKTRIEREDQTVAGFNIGMNAGEAAGQTVFHCHIHLIPRRTGDVERPRGGVRHVIPGEGDYRIEC
jgi:diadenosine tetraphosphate (Ap4A) HIT family hydrolase